MEQRILSKLALRINMHGTPKSICNIARAAMRAGLSNDQSVLLARIADMIAQGSDCPNVPTVAEGIVRQARKEHAVKHPNGKWAVLMRRYPREWMWLNDNDPRAMAWATDELDSSYRIKEAAV